MKLSRLFPKQSRIQSLHPFTGEKQEATVINHEMGSGFQAGTETAVIVRHSDGTITTLDRFSVESLNQ